MDSYIITALGAYICYFKNGKLHRESGPAAYLFEDKHKYINLEDKDLYKQGIPQKSRVEMMFLEYDLNIANAGKTDNHPHYYLEGQNYEKEVFDVIIEKNKIKEELSTELSLTTVSAKKIKI
jgi:hypothetical protein